MSKQRLRFLLAGAGLVLISLGVSMVFRSRPERYLDYRKIKDSAEKYTAPFNTGFFASYHFSVKYRVQDHKLSLVQQLRALPGRAIDRRTKGSMQVIFLDSAGNPLKSYSMPSPLYYRIEHGNARGWYRVRNGSFDVPIPFDSLKAKAIDRIIVIDKGLRMESNVANLFAGI